MEKTKQGTPSRRIANGRPSARKPFNCATTGCGELGAAGGVRKGQSRRHDRSRSRSRTRPIRQHERPRLSKQSDRYDDSGTYIDTSASGANAITLIRIPNASEPDEPPASRSNIGQGSTTTANSQSDAAGLRDSTPNDASHTAAGSNASTSNTADVKFGSVCRTNYPTVGFYGLQI